MIKTVLLDIGNVLLSNGWDTASRKLAAQTFNLDLEEFAERHGYLSALYEEGKITLNDYLDKVIFYEERNFSKTDFKNFIFSQSKSIPEMIELFKNLKLKYKFKLVALNNEGLVLSTTLCKFDKTASLNAPSLLELKPTTTPFYKI